MYRPHFPLAVAPILTAFLVATALPAQGKEKDTPAAKKAEQAPKAATKKTAKKSVKSTVKDVLAAAALKGPKGTAALVVYLSAPSAAVRKTAASKLGDRGDPSADAALAPLSKDKSAAVREAAKRARAKLHASSATVKKKIVVEVPLATALAEDVPPAATEQLTKLVRSAIIADPRRPFLIKEKVGKEPGYSLLLTIRSATDGKQGNVNLVEARCELTLLALPARALRLSSSASAAAGIEGSMSKSERTELLGDAVGACAPALAADFLDYAISRPAP